MKWLLLNFAPNFATDGYGEYGYREYHVFAGKEDAKSKMSYDSESSLMCLWFAFDPWAQITSSG